MRLLSTAECVRLGVQCIVGRTTLILALLSLSICALAQTSLPKNNQVHVVQYVKSLSASSFDSRLPRISLDYFLAYETKDAHAEWIVTRCDEHAAGPKHNSPICVQADFDLNSGGLLTILIRVDEPQDEQLRSESLVRLEVTEASGHVRQIRNLIDLPMELHRIRPSTPLKDMPLPGRDS